MTLKEFLKENNITAKPDERSQIGTLISSDNDSNGRVFEDGYNVKDYKESFLNSIKTSDIIINYFSKVTF